MWETVGTGTAPEVPSFVWHRHYEMEDTGVANTPMRPPGRPRSERRKPEGSRPVAQRPTAKDLKTKRQVQEAATIVRAEGRPELAEAVEHLLSPAGWSMLGRLRAAEGPATADTPLPIRMATADRDRIKAAQQKAAEQEASDSLTADVKEGLEAFAAGDFSPQPAAPSAYGAGEEKVNLNVRISAELKAQVEQAAEERAEELGWTPKPMHVAAAWLNAKYPAPKARARK